MQRSCLLAAGLLSAALSTTASAAIVLDGAYDADYGAAKSTVPFAPITPATPQGDFNQSQPYSSDSSYQIYLTSQNGFFYGFLRSATATGLSFSNLYFDIDPQNNNGIDLAFEINNRDAFVPGIGGPVPYAALQFVVSADGQGVEFKLPITAFTQAIPGLTYYSGHAFATEGSQVVLRLSQSFGYSVVNGVPNGTSRLGATTLVGAAAVPEPETVALMGVGVAALALTARRRRIRKA